MAGLRFAELQSRPIAFLNFTSVTLDAFQQLVPLFETAFHARMAAMGGHQRLCRHCAHDDGSIAVSQRTLLSILHSDREKITSSDAKIAWFNLTP
jgi:hypothetical protein